MRPNSEDCIRQLTPAIVEKCDALAGSPEGTNSGPTVSAVVRSGGHGTGAAGLFGVSLTLLIAPIVFMCLSTLLLLPAR